MILVSLTVFKLYTGLHQMHNSIVNP